MDNKLDNNAPGTYPGQPGAPGIVTPRPQQPSQQQQQQQQQQQEQPSQQQLSESQKLEPQPVPRQQSLQPQAQPLQPEPQAAPIYSPEYVPAKRRNAAAVWIIGGIVAALLIAAGAWWYFSSYAPDKEKETTPAATETQHLAATPSNPKGIDLINREGSPVAHSAVPTDGISEAEDSDVAAAYDESQIIDRVLSYSGIIYPGGKASLSLTLFRNSRIEGTLVKKDGKTFELSGSYEITDEENPRITLRFLALPADSSGSHDYSESWKGTSSAIADDLSHSLTFKEIYTSKGDAYTANFSYSK